MLQHLQRTFWSLYGRLVWDAQNAPWRAPQVQLMVEMLTARRVMPSEHVLDAGCGTGEYAIALAKAGFRVTGIDHARGMLSRAQAKVPDELSDNLSFQQMDLNAQLLFPGSQFDHLLNISVLQVTARPHFTLGELNRVLKPGGTLLLLHVPRPESHNLPLREIIRHRTGSLDETSPWKTVLIGVKAWAERTRHAHYWTVEELERMLEASQFDVVRVDRGPPIIFVAEKPIAVHRKG